MAAACGCRKSCRCCPPTFIRSGCCCGSIKARGTRTATRCSRRDCSRSCARIGASLGRGGGCLSGALSADGSQWIAGGRQFLFPVRGLIKMFRGQYVDGVARLLERNELDLPPQLTALGEPAGRRRLLRQWRRKSWVVYSKAPFAGPRKLVDYLGRYTHRVAISNQRLLSCDNGEVSFTYRDRSDGDRRKTMRLPVDEFLGRFLQHVLPDRFMRIRHYGLLASRDKQQRLARCRELLGAAAVAVDESPSSRTPVEWMLSLGIDITRCPCCGDILHREVLPPKPTRIVVSAASSSAAVSFTPWDTS